MWRDCALLTTDHSPLYSQLTTHNSQLLPLPWNFQSLSVKKLAGQTAIYGLSTVIGRFLNVFLTFWLTYEYGAAKFAIFSLAYAYVTFLNVVFTYGMETSFFRFMQRPEYKKDVYSTSMISLLVTTVLFTSGMIIFSDEDALRRT